MTADTNGLLTIVGIGPGAEDLLTPRARAAIEVAEVVVGYGLYLDMVRTWLPGARCIDSPIGEEEARARLALDLARAGQRVALVSSGDAGVYGMAGLALELAARDPDAPRIEVVPGLTAALAAAALVGAPLMTDYATISLSDVLLPWDQIERRLAGAAAAGFVLAIYNPTSGRRAHRFTRAIEVLRMHLPPETPCALVRDASRPDEHATLLTLDTIEHGDADMRTIVIVGNATTRVLGGRMVTPRGYRVVDEAAR